MHKREFILAMSLFVAAAVVGTGFSLWYVANYAPTSAPAPPPR